MLERSNVLLVKYMLFVHRVTFLNIYYIYKKMDFVRSRISYDMIYIYHNTRYIMYHTEVYYNEYVDI